MKMEAWNGRWKRNVGMNGEENDVAIKYEINYIFKKKY